MAARLSMLGLPFLDSIRCRLLLGFAVSAAKASNPTVAFTRSRRIRRAISGSPLRNNVAASSSSALAKAGSRRTRSTTVCLKSRVSAMSHLLSFGVVAAASAPHPTPLPAIPGSSPGRGGIRPSLPLALIPTHRNTVSLIRSREQRAHVGGGGGARGGDRERRDFGGDEVGLGAIEAHLREPLRDREA